MNRIIDLIFLLLFCNVIPLWNVVSAPTAAKVGVTAVLSLIFIVELLKNEKISVKSLRLRLLKRGTSMIWLSGAAIIPEIVVIVAYFRRSSDVLPEIFSIVMPVLAIAVTFFVGFIKTAVGSRQIKISDYLLLLLFWWFPVVNFALIMRFYRKARQEFYFESAKVELENARAENEICKTKYPVLMVHGIFFRDWQYMNYWGRVPASLIRNGATIFYGNQQSARSIPDSAEELKATILHVINETGAEKVNIIAHSKGGLDSRFAISSLGMDKYVATLTTINTPHKGCDMVDYLLGKFSEKTCNFIADRYNGIFSKLGDKNPDFLAGVNDLSAKKIQTLQPLMEDSPDVSYRSFMSVMKNAFSAGFPLNVGYLLIKKLNGKNDGLVWVGSAEHGSFRTVTAKGNRGISHGDMIDLMRENISGYDVREFYVDIVAELKNQGY